MYNLKDNIENRAETSSIDRDAAILLREKYKESGLSYIEFANILDVKENTLAAWLALKRTPTSYFVKYALEKLNEYKESLTYGNAIRKMSDEELADFLSDIKDNAIKSKETEERIALREAEKAKNEEQPKKKKRKKKAPKTEEPEDLDVFLKEEYKDMYALVNKHYDCPNTKVAPLPVIENTAAEFKSIYENSGLTYNDLSSYLNVPRPTLNMWLALRRNPPQFFVYWAKKKIKVLNADWENDGELIRNMSNQELADLLTDIRDAALKGERTLQTKYKDMSDFISNTYLIKPRLNKSFNDSVKIKRLNELTKQNGT